MDPARRRGPAAADVGGRDSIQQRSASMLAVTSVPDLADPFGAGEEPPVEGINPKDPPPEITQG